MDNVIEDLYNQWHKSVYNFGGTEVWENWRQCKRRRREAAIAEGKKPLPTRGHRERRKLPSGVWGGAPCRSRRDFEHFMQKWSTFYAKMVNGVHLGDLANLIYLAMIR